LRRSWFRGLRCGHCSGYAGPVENDGVSGQSYREDLNAFPAFLLTPESSMLN